ncbi:SufE family protein [Exilibacterium tricleocarpae]|uniref:SufE family protein n=2 Tax=Exilibacterium tricleocarpae TaxID=2591008 RepID=A0A545U719_9GAMM|nr:SufE family protein [Exilibacterium tricleocarpae]
MPFGTDITSQDIVDSLQFFGSWEERYKYIIDLGKELPGLPDVKKTEDRLVRGCQSQVWIDYVCEDGRLQLNVDSDAFIVKGLLGVVMAAYNNKSPDAVRDFDIEGYFAELNLLSHLSPTRGNGLRAMVERIKRIARECKA